MYKTERLYYDDPYLLEFDAGVLDRISVQDRFGILLDRTAFYPTSGGQPNDVGAFLTAILDEPGQAAFALEERPSTRFLGC